MLHIENNNKGVVLILTIGILAMLTFIAFFFAKNTSLEYIISTVYTDNAKAKYLAEAGLKRAIAELKADATTYFVYTLNNPSPQTYADNSLYGGRGSYNVVIEDEQRKVNINDTNPRLFQILEGLPTINVPGEGTDIISYRNGLPDSEFATPEQIKEANGFGGPPPVWV